MPQPIDILSKNQQMDLSVGIYRVYVLGGWKVILNNFSVVLREVNGEAVIKPNLTYWKIQTFAFGKRSKQIASFEVVKSGTYEIEFLNPSGLKVRRSNLMITNWFQSFLPTSDIQIYID